MLKRVFLSINKICHGYNKVKFNTIKLYNILIVKLKLLSQIKYKFNIKFFINAGLIILNSIITNNFIFIIIILFLIKAVLKQIYFLNSN